MFITQNFISQFVHISQIVYNYRRFWAFYEFTVTFYGKFKLLFFLESHCQRDTISLGINLENLNANDISDR